MQAARASHKQQPLYASDSVRTRFLRRHAPRYDSNAPRASTRALPASPVGEPNGRDGGFLPPCADDRASRMGRVIGRAISQPPDGPAPLRAKCMTPAELQRCAGMRSRRRTISGEETVLAAPKTRGRRDHAAQPRATRRFARVHASRCSTKASRPSGVEKDADTSTPTATPSCSA